MPDDVSAEEIARLLALRVRLHTLVWARCADELPASEEFAALTARLLAALGAARAERDRLRAEVGEILALVRRWQDHEADSSAARDAWLEIRQWATGCGWSHTPEPVARQLAAERDRLALRLAAAEGLLGKLSSLSLLANSSPEWFETAKVARKFVEEGGCDA